MPHIVSSYTEFFFCFHLLRVKGKWSPLLVDWFRTKAFLENTLDVQSFAGKCAKLIAFCGDINFRGCT